MSLTLSDVLSVASVAQWEAQLLSYASALGLTSTAWQPGAIARTIFAIFARALNAEDQVSYGIAAGGFLDTAASVTPEGGPGWLDLVAEYNFGVTRNPATQGTSTVAVVNAGAPIGPIPAGAYHLQAPSGHTYRNAAAVMLGTGTTTIAIVCDQFGVSDGAGTVLTPITTYSGVTTPSGITPSAVGAAVETNANLIQRCKLKLTALAPKLGGASSYVYFATTPTEPGYPAVTTPITRAKTITNPITGEVDVYLATSTGGVGGGDVALMQTYLDTVATPDGVTMVVDSASPLGIAVVMQVYCPVAYSIGSPSKVQLDVGAAIDAYITNVPIGGEPLEGGGLGVSYNGLEDYVARAVPYLRTQTTTLNATSSSVALLPDEVAVVSALTVTYAGV